MHTFLPPYVEFIHPWEKEVKEEGEAEDGEIREERKRKRKSRWENPEEEPEVKKEPAEEGELTEKPYLSRSSSRQRRIFCWN